MIASLLSLMFFINLNFIYNVYPAWIFSVHCVKEVDWKSTLKSEFQSYVFDDVRKKLVSAHCIVMSMFWLWQMKITKDIYFQSCHLMFRGLILYFVDSFTIPSKSIKTHTKQLIVWCFVSLLKLFTHIKTSPLPVKGIGARFPDCAFFIKSEKYKSVIVTCHDLHVSVLYY